MEYEQQTGDYQANDAEVCGEIFSGGLTVGDAIERLRTRRIFLPVTGCSTTAIPRADASGLPTSRASTLSLTVSMWIVRASRSGTFRNRSPPLTRGGDPRHGYTPSVWAYPPRSSSSRSAGSNGPRLHGIQTLLYPADLERQLRKIAGEAKTAIEETGTNMLFCFGFLRFYDSEDSDRPMLAPLISLGSHPRSRRDR